jgi:hypothetical protein
MQIPTDRAFWILDFYRRHRTRLHLGECHAAFVTVLDVSPTLDSMTLRMFDEAKSGSRDHVVALGHVRYFFSQLGDPSFQHGAMAGSHSVLLMEFPNGATLTFVERTAVSEALAAG